MKKIISLSTALIPLIIINSANASNYENKIFIGASIDRISVDSTFKEDGVKTDDGGKKSSISGSINTGYKMYFLEQNNGSFFITPELSFNFASLTKKHSFYESANDNGNSKYNVKPMLALDLNFGYEFIQKHSILAGVGLQYAKYDYKYNGYYYGDDESSQKDGYKLGYRTLIGYEYNLTDSISLNAKFSYSYIEPKLSSGVKVETDIINYSIGAKYNF
ncbi:MAG TPA: outer membrane beta-barrel protein [Rickettsiales bacterium]|nr:outer membrane beta-barrel protein [Rickettsiales bacterium]